MSASAFKSLFAAFEEQVCERGYKPTGGQIVDATLVSAPCQRMRKEEKEQARAGESAPAIWPDDPARAAQKDTDARWTVRDSRARKSRVFYSEVLPCACPQSPQGRAV